MNGSTIWAMALLLSLSLHANLPDQMGAQQKSLGGCDTWAFDEVTESWICLGFLNSSTGTLLKTNCKNKYPIDPYAQCVCESQNAFIDSIVKCPTSPCIGAASLARTACIPKCSTIDE